MDMANIGSYTTSVLTKSVNVSMSYAKETGFNNTLSPENTRKNCLFRF